MRSRGQLIIVAPGFIDDTVYPGLGEAAFIQLNSNDLKVLFGYGFTWLVCYSGGKIPKALALATAWVRELTCSLP